MPNRYTSRTRQAYRQYRNYRVQGVDHAPAYRRIRRSHGTRRAVAVNNRFQNRRRLNRIAGRSYRTY